MQPTLQRIKPETLQKMRTTGMVGLLAHLLKQNRAGFAATHAFFESRQGMRNTANESFLKNSSTLLRLLSPENILFVHAGEESRKRTEDIYFANHLDTTKFQFTYDGMANFYLPSGAVEKSPSLLAGCSIVLLGGFYSDPGACIDDTRTSLEYHARRMGKSIIYILNDLVSKSSDDVTFSYVR